MRLPRVGRTVRPVTIPPADAAAPRSPEQTVARAVRRLLVEVDPELHLDAVVPAIDVDIAVLDAATTVLQQVQVLGQRCVTPHRRPQLIAGITDLASSYGIASPAAIGAIGMLADQLRNPDETQLARLLATARHDMGDLDLVAGAVALVAAATTYLADAVGEPPAVVHDEIHRGRRGRPVERCREHLGHLPTTPRWI